MTDRAAPPLLSPFNLPAAHLAAFEQVMASGGNAALLSGPAYSGKANLAAAIFAAYNCSGERSVAGEACGLCPSCRALAAGNHPDLLMLRPRETTATGKTARRKVIPVTAIVAQRDKNSDFDQHVLEFLEIRPTYHRRCIIINGAEFLGAEAANALLKLVEEPPHSARFFFLSEDPHAVLPTLVSRSIPARVPPLSAPELTQLAEDAAPNELLEFAAGRPRVLEAASEVAAALESAEQFTQALGDGMLATLEAAAVLEASWSEWQAQALRFTWRHYPPPHRAQLDEALALLEEALQAYANPQLSFMNFGLASRAALGHA